MLLEDRLERIEARLAEIERRLNLRPPEPAVRTPATPTPEPAPVQREPAREPVRRRRRRSPAVSVPLVLGWAGAIALVLSGAYLVRVAIVSGWLTPVRQIATAALAGGGMVVGGFLLRDRDRRLAGLLSAAGIVVLYLTVLGAHLVHDLFPDRTAVALLIGIAGLSLALHAASRTAIFVGFALAGSYAAPFLIREGGPRVLALYLVVWNVVYSIYALWTGRRAYYLWALFLSTLVFAIGWQGARDDPGVALVYYLGQAALFTSVAVGFSLRHRRHLDDVQSLLHFIGAAFVYAVLYPVLREYGLAVATWGAVALAVTGYAAHFATRRALEGSNTAGRALVNGFGALVVVHAVVLETVPETWRPLVGLAVAVGLVTVPRIAPGARPAFWPYTVASVLLFAIGYGELVDGWRAGRVADTVLALAYPGALYAAYARMRGPTTLPGARVVLLAAAHSLAMGGATLLVGRWLAESVTTIERLWVAVAWAAIATGALAVAVVRRDSWLARSSLGVFAALVIKVVLFDLHGAGALVRTAVLAVLGVALYGGGWLYRRVSGPKIGPAAGLASDVES